jgi:hypothetical protein
MTMSNIGDFIDVALADFARGFPYSGGRGRHASSLPAQPLPQRGQLNRRQPNGSLARLVMELAQAIVSPAVHVSRSHRKLIEHVPAAAEIDPDLLRPEPKPVPRVRLLARIGQSAAAPAGKATTRRAIDPNDALTAAAAKPWPLAAKSAWRPIDGDSLGGLTGAEPPDFEFLAINVDHGYCRQLTIPPPNPSHALRFSKIAASSKFQHADETRCFDRPLHIRNLLGIFDPRFLGNMEIASYASLNADSRKP